MAPLGQRIGGFARDYLDRWLRLQEEHQPVERSSRDADRGFVMICGPCANKKEAKQSVIERRLV